ncbi:MAG: leucyl aminopeptidase [Acidobacteria bacterium]|nr:MAG: leucyl aminopeptidase [Acidobacteriota bacterium]
MLRRPESAPQGLQRGDARRAQDTGRGGHGAEDARPRHRSPDNSRLRRRHAGRRGGPGSRLGRRICGRAEARRVHRQAVRAVGDAGWRRQLEEPARSLGGRRPAARNHHRAHPPHRDDRRAFRTAAASHEHRDPLPRDRGHHAGPRGAGARRRRGARQLRGNDGNHCTPTYLADQAKQLGKEQGLKVEVLDRKQIEKIGMGSFLAVAQGSAEPPRFIVARYQGAAKGEAPVVLVGKGITFDTGGISIKPSDNMDKMKDDMSGGAAVLCAMAALSRLRAPIACIGVIPATENMPGGRAMKPGDILTSAEGKTVEVLNTDAEGRLILGDALWYARTLGVTHLVDVATLTGACVVALGRTTSGLFGRPAEWVEQVRRASERAGDRSWPMPLFDDYKDLLKSEIADFTNTGGRAGGAISAALFIKEFAGELPWVHMDIAGTAWAEETKPYQPKGATGVGVRTLVELALDVDAWGNLK